jgi:chromate transporter
MDFRAGTHSFISLSSLPKPALPSSAAASRLFPFFTAAWLKQFHWLSEQQFPDAVAVAMITPGPVVITVGFIGYLTAGLAGAVVAAAGTFLPCYLFTVIPAPYFHRIVKNPAVNEFVSGMTAAAISAIGGAVIVLGKQSLHDVPS